MQVDNDTLATLTPEEQSAIADSEMSPEELAAMQAIADGAGDDDPEDDDDDEGGEENSDPAPVESSEPAPKADDSAPAAAEKPAADEPAPAAEKSQASRYKAELPADFDDRMTAVKQETKDLQQKFRDGEIDFDAYTVAIEEINERRDELNRMAVKAEISTEMGAQTAEQEWRSNVTQFADDVAGEIDYRNDPDKNADLDIFIKRLAEDQKNADKSMRWFLDEAHKRVKALHGIAADTPPANDKKKDAAPAKPADRKPGAGAVPVTLANVPGSDGPGDVADEFASLDNLDGLALEDALAKMTPAQREKYAQTGR